MNEIKPKVNRWKSKIGGLFILSILAVMLYLLFKTHSIDEIRGLLMRMNPLWLIAALGCIIFSYITEMLSYYELAKKSDNRTNFRTSFRVTMAGQYFNSITPFAGGGQPFQIYYLMQDGIPMGRCANIIIVKSVIYEVAVFLMSVSSFIFNARRLNGIIGQFTLFFAIGVSINLIVIFFFALLLFNRTAAENVVNGVFRLLKWLRIIKDPDKYKKRKETELDSFLGGSEIIFSDIHAIVKSSFFQVLSLLSIYAIPWFMLVSLEGYKSSFFDIVTSQSVLREITAYIPSPGAAGGAEGISYFFFNNFFTKSPIVSVILMWRILTYYLNIVFGGLSLVFIRRKDKKSSEKIVESNRAASA